MYVCMYAHMCVCVYACVCTYVCMYVYMYIYKYTHTHRVEPSYKDIGLCDTSSLASDILWYQLIPRC